MNTFFISDTHFFHKNIIKYSSNSRGHFTTVEEMNESIIEDWNNKVTNDDIVYHLGDFAFTNVTTATNIVNRLKGKIILIKGNHDHKLIRSPEFSNCFTKISQYYELKLDNRFIILCHYPILSWNGKEHNSLHFHGHTHGTIKYADNAFDVGLDNKIILKSNGLPDLSPWEYSELLSHIQP